MCSTTVTGLAATAGNDYGRVVLIGMARGQPGDVRDTGPPGDRPEAATVLFGHGLLFSAWMFHHQIAALRAQFRCVAIGWRGQGESSASNGGYDMDTLTADALALIGLLGVAPVHDVGLSMGGFVGCASPPAEERCCARWFCWTPARGPKTPTRRAAPG
jgi:pimeloyl-ACP methyl ester carboxylesterase